MKKFLSIFIALTLFLTFGLAAFADDNVGTITINSPVLGQQYKIYRIFDLTYYETTSPTSYNYRLSEKWANFLDYSNVSDYLHTDAGGNVQWKAEMDQTDANKAALAKLAKEYADLNLIEDDGAKTFPENEGDATLVFNRLAFGYYLVDSTLGALCGLTSTAPRAEIIEKNEVPSLDKLVKEDSSKEWGKYNDCDVGEKVEFKAILSNLKGAVTLIYYDKMSEGFTFDEESVKVYLLHDGNEGFVPNTNNYTVNIPGEDMPNSDSPAPATFSVSFASAYLETLVEGDQIIIYYEAELNENATVGSGDPENINTGILAYDEQEHHATTPEVITRTYTWNAEVFKFYKTEENEKKALGNAKFILLDSAKEHVAKWNGDKFDSWVVYIEGTTAILDTYKLTSNENGKIFLNGLDSGDYYLKEIEAPSNYNLLKNPEKFTIAYNGPEDSNPLQLSYTVLPIDIENHRGDMLPGTGGIGTTIFYVTGALLMLGAAVLLIVRKRISATN